MTASASVKMMEIIDLLRGLAILLAFQMVGWALQHVGVPMPGGVLGLLAFYLALWLGLVELIPM